MKHGFPWFAVHKDTKFIIAGFVEYSDTEKFCGMFSHCMYVVCSGAELV